MKQQYELLPIKQTKFSVQELIGFIVAAMHFKIIIIIYAELEDNNVINVLEKLKPLCYDIKIVKKTNFNCIRFQILTYHKDKNNLEKFTALIENDLLYDIVNEFYSQKNINYEYKEIIDNHIDDLRSIIDDMLMPYLGFEKQE